MRDAIVLSISCAIHTVTFNPKIIITSHLSHEGVISAIVEALIVFLRCCVGKLLFWLLNRDERNDFADSQTLLLIGFVLVVLRYL